MNFKLFTVFVSFFFGIIISCKEKPDHKNKEDVKIKDMSALTDEQLLDTVQFQTFQYFWDGADPHSGMARERFHINGIYPTSPVNTVTTGGSGFGLMAILVGIERGFITREQGFERLQKIFNFLEKSDRFHGAWPHWLNGETGKTVPFSKKDDGGDLVETAFLIQGMLTVAEYFRHGNKKEKALVNQIEKLWHMVNWQWYTKGKDVLYWHWSPNYSWDMNFPVGGYNECLIMYILAAASPTHPIEKKVYDKGWARNGTIKNDTTFYGYRTVLDFYENDTSPTGPLFWAHYSYLGLNPKGLSDQYADYWKLNQNQAKINYAYCVDNPKNFKGYGKNLWGLTSSYSIKGYAGHRPDPDNDVGVISPTAALSSFPYTPKKSMQMLRYIYENKPEYIGKYGPYDAVSPEHDTIIKKYLAIDQGPIPVMIENYRTGLLWNLFMKNEDVKTGLNKLGFKHP